MGNPGNQERTAELGRSVKIPRVWRIILLTVSVALVVACGVSAWLIWNFTGRSDPLPLAQPEVATVAGAPFSWEPLGQVLAAHVDDRGLVDYGALLADRSPLDRQLALLAALPAEELETWNEPQRIAFWCNVYNTLMLAAVCDHWPLDAQLPSSLVFPAPSIQQIPGVWNRLTLEVAGRTVTPNVVEHAILRQEFDEPRIHFAIVCASKGCPGLRPEPYRAETLEAQLDEEARRFLASPRGATLLAADHLALSAILNWFGEDFAPKGVLDFVQRHAPPEVAEAIRTNPNLRVTFSAYDWSLNAQD